jgi:hypothetical protein
VTWIRLLTSYQYTGGWTEATTTVVQVPVLWRCMQRHYAFAGKLLMLVAGVMIVLSIYGFRGFVRIQIYEAGCEFSRAVLAEASAERSRRPHRSGVFILEFRLIGTPPLYLVVIPVG